MIHLSNNRGQMMLSYQQKISQLSKIIEEKNNLTLEDARWLYQHGLDSDLQTLAQIAKMQHHPKDEATYLIMGIINFTNICTAGCDYCSFYRNPGAKDSYTLSFEQVCQRIDAIKALGGSLVSFNNGFNPHFKMNDYQELLQKFT